MKRGNNYWEIHSPPPPKYSLLQEICPHQGKLFSYYFARVNQATAQVLCCQRALPRK